LCLAIGQLKSEIAGIRQAARRRLRPFRSRHRFFVDDDERMIDARLLNCPKPPSRLSMFSVDQRCALDISRSRPPKRQGSLAHIDVLEDRLAPAALAAGAPLANVDGNLAALYWLTQTDASASIPKHVGNVVPSADSLRSMFLQDQGGRPLVEIWTRAATESATTALAGLGITPVHINEPYHLIEAVLDLDRLLDVAQLPSVLAVTPAYRPQARAGSVQTQGDAVMRSNLVRQAGFDGSSVKVGVVSDSTFDLSLSQASGDLPMTVDRYRELMGDDEGRAMMEIIYDIAPGAGLAMNSGSFGESLFAQGIRELAAAGCQIIVDDIGYPNEPFFQDGIIAQAVNEVTAAGVTYFSAAGNDGDLSYSASFTDADASSGIDLHDFDPGPGVDTRQNIVSPAGDYVSLTLQWDDPFYTTSGVTHDFDVTVYDDFGNVVASGTTDNVATQSPYEIIGWDTTGNGSYHIELERLAGSGPSTLKYIVQAYDVSIAEYVTHSTTIYGHTAAANAIAVGAVPFYAPDTIEPYSSRGDVTIYMDPAGTRLSTPEVRSKPELVAPDNVNTSFFGDDIPQDSDTRPNFGGTSAAAPHAAGVAALLLSVNPHLTRTELENVLSSSAVDLGAPGVDSIYGSGRVDAEAARLAAMAIPDVTAPTAQLVTPVSTAGWPVPKIVVRFSEPLSAAAANDGAHYTLVGAGADAVFRSDDDVAYTTNVAYSAPARTGTLTLSAPNLTLPVGRYRLTLDATSGLTDESGNALNGGSDQVIAFTVATRSEVVRQPFIVEENYGGPAMDVRPDGTTVIVHTANPFGHLYNWAQFVLGQFDAGGGAPGAFQTIPTEMDYSYLAENVDVATGASGGVVVYSDYIDSPLGAPDIFDLSLQRFDANGRPLGARRLIKSIDAYDDYAPRLDMIDSGAFVVVYPNLVYNFATDDYDQNIYGRRYNASATAQGSEFKINQAVGASDATVAMAPDGSFVVVWERNGAIMARRYNASGVAQTSEIQLATPPANLRCTQPQVAQKADGSFIVTWWLAPADPFAEPFSQGVVVQQFSPFGAPLAAATQVFDAGVEPQIAVAGDGRFAVAFNCPDVNADGNDEGLFVQRFNADGSLFDTKLSPTAIKTGEQANARIAMLADGRFVVSWTEDAGSKVRWFAWDDPSVPNVSPVATSTTLIATPLATTGGSSVMFTATVAPAPGSAGVVTYLDNGVPIPNGSNVPLVDSVAVFSTTTLALGGHPVTAAYSGAAGFAASISNTQTVVIGAQPQVASVTINGNIPGLSDPQRSRVASLVVAFDQPVQLDTGALTLALHPLGVVYDGAARPSGYGVVPTSLNFASTDNTTWIVTFTGNTEDGADGLRSLKDGVYDLKIDSAKVHPSGVPNLNMAASFTTTFHRLFGDIDPPGTPSGGSAGVDFSALVNTGDNFVFRDAFNRPAPNYKAYLDIDGSGVINTGDNLEFRDRFNKTLSWKI
jgi:subtilisin family serine protease